MPLVISGSIGFTIFFIIAAAIFRNDVDRPIGSLFVPETSMSRRSHVSGGRDIGYESKDEKADSDLDAHAITENPTWNADASSI